MSRPHDMGGRTAGTIPDKDDATVFHKDWHARALALNLACGALGAWNIDASRFARERLKDYAGLSYYEKWMGGLADLLVGRNLLDAETLAAPPTVAAPLAARALRAKDVPAAMHARLPYSRSTGPAPRFQTGDQVRTLPAPLPGHCRLPAYAAGRSGKIVLCHGNHVFPDSNALFKGEAPQPLYTVEFSATELWGAGAEATGDQMRLDLWQAYLEPA